MAINPNVFIKLYIVIFVLVISFLSYKVFEQITFVQKQRKQLTNGFYDANLEKISYEDNIQKKFKQRKMNARKIMKMKAIIKQVNLNQKIYNEHISRQETEAKYIVVIQVHSNVYLFKQLLASLKSAYSISEALLIFSHDIFDPEINKAVHSVNFARYMQIFLPYSIQLHPYVFPGGERDNQDSNSTEKNTREPILAQEKHHWWWQMNQVFDHLNVTKRHAAPILFLEEDNYVTLDFLVVFNILQFTKSKECPACELISLGAHKPTSAFYGEKAMITLEMWEKKTPNIGIGIDRYVWHSIKNYSHDFCHFDDHNWDSTLKYLGSKRMDTNFYLTAIDGPRVFRLAKCPESDLTCKPESKVQRVIDFNEKIHRWMFPIQISVKMKISSYFTVYPIGSFSDSRDHELCMYLSKNNVWY